MKKIIKLTLAVFIALTFFACSKNDVSYVAPNRYDYAANMTRGICEKCGSSAGYKDVEEVVIQGEKKRYCRQHIEAARNAANNLKAWQK